MKFHSIQFKFLITVISAMLAITVFIGGLSIYEVDKFIQHQTTDFIHATCEKEATQVNDIFGDMEKSVSIMSSYVLDLVNSSEDIHDPGTQTRIVDSADNMFADVAKYTNGTIAYYLRFSPELSGSKAGLFYSQINGGTDYVQLELTDLSLYARDDTEHVGWYWQPYDAGHPIWMQPYYNQNNNVLMISYVVPLYHNEQFIGVVGMDFDYTVLTDKVHEIKLYENGFAHLESNGSVIHSDNEPDADADGYLQVSEELLNGMTLVLSASYDDIRQIRYDIAFKILFVVLLLSALFSLVVIFVVRRIVVPLKELTEVSKTLSTGNYDVKISHSNTYEIKLLGSAFENMAARLQEHARFQHLLAYRDSLTGLRNTTSYQAWQTDFNAEIQRNPVDFGVVVLDLNYLKETNDKYGHDTGNKLIVAAARIISLTFMRSPVFRIGGDEFLVILQKNGDLETWDTLFETLDSKCANEFIDADGTPIAVSIAKGFAQYDPDKDTQFVDVFNRADDAMYQNKRAMKSAATMFGR